MRHWLMKSEPSVYSIDDLRRDEKTWWTGVRNYMARNYMSQDMKVGDRGFFYHSNADPPGIAGIVRVSRRAAADPTQFDRAAEGYEPRATPDAPVWMCVEVSFVERAARFVSLDELRTVPSLADMELLRRGSRLSIQPVEPAAFRTIAKLLKTSGAARGA